MGSLRDGHRVKQSCVTNSLNTPNDSLLLTPIAGYQNFTDVFEKRIPEFSDGDYFFYDIQDGNGIQWEFGIGYIGIEGFLNGEIIGSPLLMRDRIIRSSNFNQETQTYNRITLSTDATKPHLVANMPADGYATGDMDFQNCYLSNPMLKGYSRKMELVAINSGIIDINPSVSSVFGAYITENCSINLGSYNPYAEFNFRLNPDFSSVMFEREFTLYLQQDWNGGYVVDLPACVSSSSFSVSQSANSITVLRLKTINLGVSWLCDLVGIYQL